MKKILALILAGCMVLSMAACGGSETAAPTEENTATTEETKEEAPAEKAEETAEEVAAEVPAGGKVGVCIYKFDDAFMTTYRNALQAILEEKGYEVSVVDGNNDQAKQTEQVNTFITQGVDPLNRWQHTTNLFMLVVTQLSPVPSRAKSFWKPKTKVTSTATVKFPTL